MRSVGKLISSRVGGRTAFLALAMLSTLGVASADALPRHSPRLAHASGAPLKFAQAPQWIATHRGGYASDPASPGPAVNVNVPNSGGGMGFIEVWAQVKANASQTAVGLFDVTGGHKTFVSGQETLCAEHTNVRIPGDLFMTLDGVPGTYGTPMPGAPFCAGTFGPPGPVLLRVPAGKRKFRLEYANCGCGGVAAVSHRWLWIRAAPSS